MTSCGHDWRNSKISNCGQRRLSTLRVPARLRRVWALNVPVNWLAIAPFTSAGWRGMRAFLSFQYEGFGIPLMRRATNRWSVVPHAEQSLLISEAELEIKGGIFGRLLEPILAPIMRRM